MGLVPCKLGLAKDLCLGVCTSRAIGREANPTTQTLEVANTGQISTYSYPKDNLSKKEGRPHTCIHGKPSLGGLRQHGEEIQ